MPLLELTHVEAYHRTLRAEEELGERACDLGFADARGPEEEERADGAVRVLQAGARAAYGARERGDGGALRDDAAPQLLLDAQKLLRLLLLERRDGDASPARNHFLDVVFGHLDRHQHLLVVNERGGETRAAHVGAAFVVVAARHAAGHVASRAQLDARAGLVNHVNGFVGEEAVGDVSVRLVDGRLDGVLGVAHLVERLVALAHAVEDGDGLLFGRRRDFDGLEAALQRAVFLD